LASNTIVQSGDQLGGIFFAGDDGANINSSGASIVAAVDGTPGTNDMPGRLVFSTTADGASAPTERLRIGSAGQFGIAGANYGTSGQVLTSGGSGAAPSWATPSGGVTSLTAGNGITVSASTGAVTVSQDIYTGSSNSNTSFPIGTNVLIDSGGTFSARATAQTLYYSTTETEKFFKASGANRTAITGTWRQRGFSNSDGQQPELYQRTA